jgi:uncharacterized repeat protein (TIGR03803 family)
MNMTVSRVRTEKSGLRLFQALGVGIAFASVPLVTAAAAHLPNPATSAGITAQSATLSLQHTLNSSIDGLFPSPMTNGPGGALYGLTTAGGPNGMGTIYKVGPDGTFSVVHAFDANEGWALGGLIPGGDGSLYGATTDIYTQSGQQPVTVVFRIAADGHYSVLHQFAPVDNPDAPGNQEPYINADGTGRAAIVVAGDGTVYGTKNGGGANGAGTVFKIDPQGNFTLLHAFTAIDPNTGLNDDGAAPTGVAIASTGNLYGVASRGGTQGSGAIFKITSSGAFSIARTITDAGDYDFSLLAGKDGNVYGRVRYSTAGAHNGYVFKLDSAGRFSKLYTASLGLTQNYVDDLILGADGNLYAVIDNAGETIVRITPTGARSVLHTFDPPVYSFSCYIGCSTDIGYGNLDGHFSTLRQGSDGNLYGVAGSGGVNGSGVIFRMALDGSAFTVLFTFGSGPGYQAGNPFGQTADDGHGNLYGALYGLAPQGQYSLYKLTPDGPVQVTASADPSSVAAGETTTLTWASTGATNCALNGVVTPQNGQYQGLPASGSINVKTPLDFSAGHPGFSITFYTEYVMSVQCTATDGSIANTALSIAKSKAGQ